MQIQCFPPFSLDPVRSGRNNKLDTKEMGTNSVRLTYFKNSVKNVTPIISDREYLLDQHILVAVRAEDDNEVTGLFPLSFLYYT